MRDRLRPGDGIDALPSTAADAVRDSAAAGLAVAERIGAQGPALAAAVRSAFMDG